MESYIELSEALLRGMGFNLITNTFEQPLEEPFAERIDLDAGIDEAETLD